MPRQPAKDFRSLQLYLKQAGETGIRAYVEMLIGSLQARAAQTHTHLDDVLVIALRVLLERLFPPSKPEGLPPNAGDMPGDERG